MFVRCLAGILPAAEAVFCVERFVEMFNRTRDKILKLFRANFGYMNYDSLKNEGIGVLQLRVLEDEGAVSKFSRGWYWCDKCGFNRPSDHKYIEICKVDPQAVICLDSACHIAGVCSEPEVVKVATPRDDRRKIECDFAVRRFYYTHMEEEYIRVVKTEFGNYRYFAPERAVVDCMQDTKRVEPQCLSGILSYNNTNKVKVNEYRKFIRAIKQNERKRRANERI